MKVNFKNLLLLAVLVCAAVIGLRYLSDSRQMKEQSRTVAATSLEAVSENSLDQARLNPEELNKIVENNPQLQKRAALQSAMNSDVAFFGKIVDQHGDPVAGVRIRYELSVYTAPAPLPNLGPDAYSPVIYSDAEGAFSVSHERGLRLQIVSMQKPGYVFANDGRSRIFKYSKRSVADELHEPDPANPVIFRSWKKGYVSKELLSGSDYWTYRADGKFYKIPMEGLESDLQVHFELLGKNGETTDRQWRATLKFSDGGLIETSDSFLYEAPESGYQTEWSITAGENDWIERKFYFQARNGQVYGRINMKLTGYYGDRAETRTKGFIDYDYALNPTGSRNLLSDSD